MLFNPLKSNGENNFTRFSYNEIPILTCNFGVNCSTNRGTTLLKLIFDDDYCSLNISYTLFEKENALEALEII